jgi:hypothetical protein
MIGLIQILTTGHRQFQQAFASERIHDIEIASGASYAPLPGDLGCNSRF